MAATTLDDASWFGIDYKKKIAEIVKLVIKEKQHNILRIFLQYTNSLIGIY